MEQGHFRAPRACPGCSSPGGAPPLGGEAGGSLPGTGGARWELNLHALTAGVAMLSLYLWLQDLK